MVLAVKLGSSLNWVDMVSLIFVAAFFVYGVVRGFMLQLAGIVVIVLGLVVASAVSGTLGRWLNVRVTALTPLAAKYVCFAVVFLITLGAGYGLSHLLRGALDKAKVLAYDHLLGGVLGILKAGLILILATQLYLNLSLPPDQKPEGVSADIVSSRTGRIVKWSSERLLVFLPADISEKLRDYDKLN